MENRKIIAIIGMAASGKTTIVNKLLGDHNWPKVYFGAITFEEIERRGLEITQTNEKIVRESLRKKFGNDHYAKKVIEKIHSIEKTTPVVLVESLYSWTEYKEFKKEFGNNFITVLVYAPPRVRHERIKNRKDRSLSEKEAWARDCAELEGVDKGGPIAMADFFIDNTRCSLEELYEKTDKIIPEILSV